MANTEAPVEETEAVEEHGWVHLWIGHQDGLVTTVNFPYLPGHDGVQAIKSAYKLTPGEHKDAPATLEIDPLLSDHSKEMVKWMHGLPEEQHGYFTHLKEVAYGGDGQGIWERHKTGGDLPAWVSAPDHPEFEKMLAEHYSVRGHETKIGADLATWIKGVENGLSNIGKDATARAVGGYMGGLASTATSTSATSLTDTTAPFVASSGGPPAGGGNTGQVVLSGNVYGIVLASSTTVLTVDCWHSISSPDTVGSTPAGTATYALLPAGAPFSWVAISVATRVFTAGDNFLTNDGSTISEIWFSGGGLNRKLCTFAHTAGTATYTQAATWTGNGSDTYPQVVASWGNFQAKMITTPSTSNTGQMQLRTVLGSTATMAASGDQLTVTDTVTLGP